MLDVVTLPAALLVEVAVERVALDGVFVGVVGFVQDLLQTADILGLALEVVVALVAAVEQAALGLPVGHVDGGQRRGLVVLGLVVVRLVDRDGGVDDVRLDGLLVDYGLDGLVEMVVNMLSLDNGGMGLCASGIVDNPLITETLGLGCEPATGLLVVAVVKLAVLHAAELVVVLLRQNLLGFDWLYRLVVVVLVYLAVDGCVDVLMLLGLDRLVLDCRGSGRMDCGVVVTRLGGEVTDSCLGLLHDCGFAKVVMVSVCMCGKMSIG
jgi:hypothetical protein